MTITPEGGRVLGCLVEKQLTTPQQYPLTLNALSLACSQATNREPVMTLDEATVQRALDELKGLHLVRFVLPSHGRSVIRYRHVLDEAQGLDTARVALVAVLLLRGPQTVGELRTRTARMAEFDSLGAVATEMEALADRPEPLVQLLPRQPGQKEDRWQQLLAEETSGVGMPRGFEPTTRLEPDNPAQGSAPFDAPAHGAPSGTTDRPSDRVDLESRLDELASEVAALRGQIAELGSSLGALRHSLGE